MRSLSRCRIVYTLERGKLGEPHVTEEAEEHTLRGGI
jgi:hypothetical protein